MVVVEVVNKLVVSGGVSMVAVNHGTETVEIIH